MTGERTDDGMVTRVRLADGEEYEFAPAGLTAEEVALRRVVRRLMSRETVDQLEYDCVLAGAVEKSLRRANAGQDVDAALGAIVTRGPDANDSDVLAALLGRTTPAGGGDESQGPAG